jgi:hypothetical protein
MDITNWIEEIEMSIYRQLYEFAASAGALEGYVYPRDKLDPQYLPNWVNHLHTAYKILPEDVREEIQPFLDGTLGRAVRSLIPVLGEGHEVITKLKSMIRGELPKSHDDFQKKKWFE